MSPLDEKAGAPSGQKGATQDGVPDGGAPQRLIMMGPPVSRRSQRKLGIQKFIPGLGYEKRSCSRCSKLLWLGPNQAAKVAATPGIEILCTTCILPELKAGLGTGRITLTHLGGRGSAYYHSNGHSYGPPEEFQN